MLHETWVGRWRLRLQWLVLWWGVLVGRLWRRGVRLRRLRGRVVRVVRRWVVWRGWQLVQWWHSKVGRRVRWGRWQRRWQRRVVHRRMRRHWWRGRQWEGLWCHLAGVRVRHVLLLRVQ